MRKPAVLAFLIPGLAGFLIFFFIPFLSSLGYAFADGGKPILETLNNEAFLQAMGNTLKFMLICVPLNLVLPLLVGVAVKSLGDKSRIFQMAYISPLVVPVASVALFWQILFSKGGSINQMLSFLGLGNTDFLNSGWAIVVIALITVWKNLGYMMVLYIAGLSEIPQSYYESASMDGAGGIYQFFKITLPCLRPTIFLVFVMSFVNCFKVFREIYLIAGAYPHSSIYMLQHFINNMFQGGRNGMLVSGALIIAVIIIGVLLVAFILNNRAQRRMGR